VSRERESMRDTLHRPSAMRDLQLWRDLQVGAPRVADLEELAARRFERRVPYFGAVAAHTTHDDPDVRAACLSVLAGALGMRALRPLVGALDDERAEVREAAVGALHASAVREPGLWLHVLVHRRGDVRARALEYSPPRPADLAYLLADPTLRDEIIRRVETGEVQLPPSPIALLLAWMRRGELSPAKAAQWLLPLAGDVKELVLRFGPVRTNAEAAAVLRDGEGRGEDVFDDYFRCLEHAEPEARRRHLRGVRVALAPTQLDEAEAVGARVAAAALLHVRTGGSDDFAPMIAWWRPDILVSELLPRVTRRAVLGELLRGDGRRDDDAASALLRGDLVRREDGALDLPVVAAGVMLMSRRRYGRLYRAIPQEVLVEACVADPAGAARLLLIPGEGRDTLLKRIADVSAKGHARCVALTVLLDGSAGRKVDEVLADDPALVLDVVSGMVRAERDVVEISAKRRIAIAKLVVARVPRHRGESLVRAWLDEDPTGESALGRELLAALARQLTTKQLVEACDALDPAEAEKLVAVLPDCSRVPYGAERALAEHWMTHDSERVRAWAATRAVDAPTPTEPVPESVETLGATSAREITDARDLQLALSRYRRPTQGLVGALEKRKPSGPSVPVCVALLAAHDPLRRVATQLRRFAAGKAKFVSRLDAAASDRWLGSSILPIQAQVWLYRWERHAMAATARMQREGLAPWLRTWADQPWSPLRRRGWLAVARAYRCWQHGQRERIELDESTIEVCVEHLDTEVGEAAAQILVVAHRLVPSKVPLPAIRGKLPSCVAAVRAILRDLVSAAGLPARRGVARVLGDVTDHVALVRSCDAIDALLGYARAVDARIVDEAVQRLFELGADGEAALLTLLDEGGRAGVFVAALVSLFEHVPEATLRERLRPPCSPEVRFRLAMTLDELDAAVDALDSPAERAWLQPSDWEELVERFGDWAELCLRVACSPQPAAYVPAVEALLVRKDEEAAARLRDFLEVEGPREHELRKRAGFVAYRRGHTDALPLVLDVAFTSKPPRPKPADGPLVEAALHAALHAGSGEENQARQLLGTQRFEELPRWAAEVLPDARGVALRSWAANELQTARPRDRDRRTRAMAEVCAWGVRRARALTGSLYQVRYVPEPDALGYTRLDERRVYVSGIPMLRGDRHGRDIVEGLVLHEIGHHLFHAGAQDQKVWEEAKATGLFGVLNLVADEHLERNLRALDASYGDRLKRLAAYAFQHRGREILASQLLAQLGPAAALILREVSLQPGFWASTVWVESGALLRALEEQGHGWARFVRALRMGLGNRQDDPRVAEALRLFRGKQFRKSSMEDLLVIAKRLRELFGLETRLAEGVGGGHEAPGEPLGESDRVGGDLDDAEIQREVKRILSPPREQRGGDRRAGRDALTINVGPDLEFPKITDVRPLARAPGKHRLLAREVGRHARRLRSNLEALGLALEPRGGRLRGSHFDRSRIRPLVVRGDPRVLVARERVVRADLFVGVAIDCSGSMHGASMERAHRYGVLIAEAARGLAGVDVRFVGFTDRELFDAGDANRCAVSSLESGGGNNDAAGLWHVAQLARRSRRSAKLLVMISDGLPTECSVAALRAYVRRLERRERFCCAQVAVRSLEERCFTHYVEVLEPDLGKSVGRFGQIVTRLIGRAMKR